MIDSPRRLRVLFIGQSTPFSWPSVRMLADRHELVGIVESLPASAPRRQSPAKTIVKALAGASASRPWLDRFARARRVAYLRLRRTEMGELEALLERVRPDVGCVASMAQLLPTALLAAPRHGFLNVHPALLPSYRGANPIFWQLLDECTTMGSTVHRIESGEDTGAILAQSPAMPSSRFASPEETIAVLGEAGAVALDDALTALANGTAVEIRQPQLSPTARARTLKAGEQVFDWEGWPLERVARLLRMTAPWHQELPPAGRWRRWEVVRVDRSRSALAARQLAKEGRRWRVGHPEGSIILRKRWAR